MISTSRRRGVHFALCVVLLGVCSAFIRVANLRLIKGALPIRKPLADFDRSKLAPLELTNVLKLSQETVEELGTKEYLDWVLSAPKDGDSRIGCTLSVTYYTGTVDQVPHVPEECLYQGAFTQASDDMMKMALPKLGETIEIRRLSFYPPRNITTRSYVYYTICVNGVFSGHRDVVRLHMANPLDSHLYYSKVEVAIREPANGKIEELDEAARDILDKTITELMRSHWPLRGWERGGPPPETGAKAGGGMRQTASNGV